MDLRVIGNLIEEKLKTREQFTLYYAKVKQTGEIVCNPIDFFANLDYGFPMLRPVNKKQAQQLGYTNIQIYDKKTHDVSHRIDSTTRSFGRNREEALQGILNSIEFGIQQKQATIATYQKRIEEHKKEFAKIKECIKTE